MLAAMTAASAKARRGARAGAQPEPFGIFPPATAAALRAAGVHRCWKDGESILPRGAVVPSVMAVLRGRLRIAAAAELGHEVFFRWQQPGEIVGLASAVSGLAFPVSAVAFDACETLEVEREVLLDCLRSNAEAALTAARLLASHAYDLIHLVTLRTEQTLTGRVLGVLQHLALLNGQPAGAEAWSLEISQRDIAAALGASRQRVNTELRTLERAGLIRLGYGQVLVLSMSGPPPSPGAR